jgi:hypothetical protein
MNNLPRPISAKTIWDIIGRKPILLVPGLIFTLIPLFIGSIFFLIYSLLDNDVPKVNYERIQRSGTRAKAVVTDIDIQQNVTINNAHPAVISYSYHHDGKETQSKYQTLDEYKVARMTTGDTIEIKYIGNDSIIETLEPISFPFEVLTTIACIFLSVGLLFLTLLFFYVRKHASLYRYGIIREAKIISIGSSGPRLRRGINVHYQYTTSRGQSLLGESDTNDLTILGKNQDDLIKIFVSPVDESKSCLIPKLDVVRNNWQV